MLSSSTGRPHRALLFPRIPTTPVIDSSVGLSAPESNGNDRHDVGYDKLQSELSRWWSVIDVKAEQLGLNRSEQKPGKSRSNAWRKRCRRFQVGERKDYKASIRPALGALGLCETATDHWDTYWGEQWLEFDEFTNKRISETLRAPP